MQYVEKYWTYFRQTFSVGAFWDKDERFKFWCQNVKYQVTARSDICELLQQAELCTSTLGR